MSIYRYQTDVPQRFLGTLMMISDDVADVDLKTGRSCETLRDHRVANKVIVSSVC